MRKSQIEYQRERDAHDTDVKMTISSKVPSKWRFVDLETNDVWEWNEKRNTFTRAKEIIVVQETGQVA